MERWMVNLSPLTSVNRSRICARTSVSWASWGNNLFHEGQLYLYSNLAVRKGLRGRNQRKSTNLHLPAYLWVMHKSTSFWSRRKFSWCCIFKALNYCLKPKNKKKVRTVRLFLPQLTKSALVNTYSFSRSVWSDQHSQGVEERDDLFVFILYSKAPHPQDAHLLYSGHFCFLKERTATDASLFS